MSMRGFNLPEGRDGFKRDISKHSAAMIKSFNLPEGRDGFKRLQLLPKLPRFERVSIYPKAEMGLRERLKSIMQEVTASFNLPEGRDGFKSPCRVPSKAKASCFNLPEGRDGFKRITIFQGYLKRKTTFQSTRRQRWV